MHNVVYFIADNGTATKRTREGPIGGVGVVDKVDNRRDNRGTTPNGINMVE